MQNLLRDLRYALRQLRKSPGFTLTAVATLALGIGINTAVFSVVYGLLLRSLPFHEAERIVNISETHPQIPDGAEATFPDYKDWRIQQRSFEQIAAYSTANPSTVSLVMDGRAEQVHRVLASGGFFSVLGVSPLLGRTLNEQDDQPGRDHVAVLSAAAWERYFGRDIGVVGRTVALNGSAFTIIGVLPANAAYPAEGEVWLPLSLLDQATQASRVWHSVNVIGRLHPDVGLKEATADMRTVATRIAGAYPATNRNVSVRITPLREQLLGTLRPAILSVMGSVVLVLLMACANVANLLMMRATADRREIVLRQALGAGRMRLFSQFLTQTMILCLLGSALGMVVAAFALPLLRLALSHTAGIDPSLVQSMTQSIGLNLPALLFTLATCTLTAVLFGLLPVMKTSSKLAEGLRPGDRGNTGSYGWSKDVLIAGEIAVAIVVLFLSTLVIRSFQKLLAIDPGFRTDHLLSLEVTLPQPKYKEGAPAANHFYEQLLDKITQSPGVRSVASTTVVLLTPSRVMTRFLVEGAPPLAAGAFPFAQIRYVSPGFFHTMGLSLQQGRVFEQKDIENNSDLFVVNQAFAQRYLSGRSSLSANILIGVLSPQPEKVPVIGVVSNAHDLGVATDPQPEIYLPGFGLHEVLLVRTGSDPQSIVPMIRKAVQTLDPDQPIYNIQTLDQVLSDSLARQKMTALLLGIFALMALALAAVGIYGVLAYSVTRRTREIGVRMAVGAQRQNILHLVLWRAFKLVAVGLAGGLVIAFASTRLLEGLLFKTSAMDPFSAVIAIGALMAIAALAVSLPARRAASVNPTDALRAE